jgi:type II secretory pathway pseudopilin PulG
VPRRVVCRFRNQRGVTYLMLMFVIVLIGLTMTAAAKQWKAMVQREREADLLAKGMEIQNALALYSAARKAGRVMPGEVYPQSLADLTRLPKPFLRKVYSDPMTYGDWEYLRAPTGGIMGVRSKSRAKPFRKHNFPDAVRHFDGRATYYDWVFQYPNPSLGGSFPPGTVPNQPGTVSNAMLVTPSSIPTPSESEVLPNP